MQDVILIIPTAAGVRVSVNGAEVMKLMDAKQLVSMSADFMHAAAERLSQSEPEEQV